MIRPALPALRKGHNEKVGVARRAQKEEIDTQLHPMMERTFRMIFREDHSAEDHKVNSQIYN
jgi:hypothetical protein